MLEIRTREDLNKALICKDNEIHIDDKQLTLGIMTTPCKHRAFLTVMKLKGYRLITARCFGAFDVRFIRY